MKLGRMLCRLCPGWLFFDDRLQPNWHQRSRMSYRHADSIHPHISLIHPPAKSLSNAAPKSKFSVVLGPSKCNYYFFVYSNNSISHKSSTGPVEC